MRKTGIDRDLRTPRRGPPESAEDFFAAGVETAPARSTQG
ncbi:hypothetical protein ATKI12_6155 [Kitasatospora sp. Ki12]